MEVVSVCLVRVVAAAGTGLGQVGRVQVENRVLSVVRRDDLQCVPVVDDDCSQPVGDLVQALHKIPGRGGVGVLGPYAVGPASAAAGSRSVVALGGPHEEAAGAFQVGDAVLGEVGGRELVSRVRGVPQRPDQVVRGVSQDAEERHDVAVQVVDDLNGRGRLGKQYCGGSGERFHVDAVARHEVDDLTG